MMSSGLRELMEEERAEDIAEERILFNSHFIHKTKPYRLGFLFTKFIVYIIDKKCYNRYVFWYRILAEFVLKYM